MKSRKPFLLALLSCISTVAFASDAKLHGIITNPLSDSIQVSFNYSSNVIYKPETYYARLDKSGHFDLSFPLVDKYTHVIIQHGDQATEVFMTPKDDLEMTVDAQHFDSTLHYEGKGKEIANYVARHVMETGMIRDDGRAVQQLYIKDPQDFEKGLIKRDSAEYAFMAINGHFLPGGFHNYWEAMLKYRHYGYLLEYPFAHEVVVEQSYNVKINKGDMATIHIVPVAFNDEYLGLSDYDGYVRSLYDMKVRATLDSPYRYQDQKMIDSSVNVAMKKNAPHGSAEYYFASKLAYTVKAMTGRQADSSFAAYKKDYPNSKYTSQLDNIVAMKMKLSKGMPALDFDIMTPEGQKMKLSDLKGKVVYLDFWASWCGPCKAELPHEKEVHEHFKDKPVAFVYVSIDDDTASWKKAIAHFNIEGIHTVSKGNFSSPIATEYDIKGIPSYFLIDKNGNFALDSTPRPSDTEELIADIEELLK